MALNNAALTGDQSSALTQIKADYDTAVGNIQTITTSTDLSEANVADELNSRFSTAAAYFSGDTTASTVTLSDINNELPTDADIQLLRDNNNNSAADDLQSKKDQLESLLVAKDLADNIATRSAKESEAQSTYYDNLDSATQAQLSDNSIATIVDHYNNIDSAITSLGTLKTSQLVSDADTARENANKMQDLHDVFDAHVKIAAKNATLNTVTTYFNNINPNVTVANTPSDVYNHYNQLYADTGTAKTKAENLQAALLIDDAVDARALATATTAQKNALQTLLDTVVPHMAVVEKSAIESMVTNNHHASIAASFNIIDTPESVYNYYDQTGVPNAIVAHEKAIALKGVDIIDNVVVAKDIESATIAKRDALQNAHDTLAAHKAVIDVQNVAQNVSNNYHANIHTDFGVVDTPEKVFEHYNKLKDDSQTTYDKALALKEKIIINDAVVAADIVNSTTLERDNIQAAHDKSAILDTKLADAVAPYNTYNSALTEEGNRLAIYNTAKGLSDAQTADVAVKAGIVNTLTGELNDKDIARNAAKDDYDNSMADVNAKYGEWANTANTESLSLKQNAEAVQQALDDIVGGTDSLN